MMLGRQTCLTKTVNLPLKSIFLANFKFSHREKRRVTGYINKQPRLREPIPYKPGGFSWASSP